MSGMQKAGSLLLATFGFFLFACSGASDQQPQSIYRAGQPEVLLAPPPPKLPITEPVEVPAPQIRENFRSAYVAAGSPRLAVFWNRALTDSLRDMQADEKVIVEQSSRKSSGEGDESSSEEAERTEVKIETRQEEELRHSPVSEIGELRFQAGYLGPLLAEGAIIIDRASVMRITDARRLADGPALIDDQQLIEISALQEYADLLIQIALVASAESKTGTFFHITITDLESGQIRASFFHDGVFPLPPSTVRQVWKASENGGYVLTRVETRANQPLVVDLELMGKTLAEATMTALTENQ